MITPRTPAPELTVATLSGSVWSLATRSPQNFTFVAFYRGLHCPICSRHLKAIETALPTFAEKGLDVLAISMDTQQRAQESYEKWGLSSLEVGYGLTLDQAEAWGLSFSASIKDSEPAVFSEPGHFLIRPNNEVYYASVQSAPFSRPSPTELLGVMDFVINNDYPARGELSSDQARAIVG